MMFRLCLCKHLRAEFRLQVGRGQQIDMDAKQSLQFDLQPTKVKQRCAG